MCIDVSQSGLFSQVPKQERVGADLILWEDHCSCGKKEKRELMGSVYRELEDNWQIESYSS